MLLERKGVKTMVEISETLKNDNFRFIKVKRRTKQACEYNWSSEGYRFDDPELRGHLMNKGNYGVLCGYGDMTVIDADIEEIERLVDENLPDTFKVRSGGGGCHFYFTCPDLEGPIRLKDNKVGDIGDVQYKGKMVVGPNSIHPSRNRYKIEKKNRISEIKRKDIEKTLGDFFAGKKSQRKK